MALDPGILEAVTNANFKSIGEMGAINALMEQKQLGMLAQASLGQILNKMNGMDPSEASSLATLGASDTGKITAELGGVAASLKQFVSAAQITGPQG